MTEPTTKAGQRLTVDYPQVAWDILAIEAEARQSDDRLREAAQAVLLWCGDPFDVEPCQVCGAYAEEGHAEACGASDLRDALASHPTPSGTPDREPEENNMTDTLAFPTTDASRWAAEFVRLHGGDEGLMLAWFANAIEHGRGPSGTPDRERLGYSAVPTDTGWEVWDRETGNIVEAWSAPVRPEGLDEERLAVVEAMEREGVVTWGDDGHRERFLAMLPVHLAAIAREYQRIIESR